MAPAHAHPGLVAVRAGLPDRDGKREFSSGLLIAPRLVLTARHGVVARGVPGVPDGTVLPGIEVSCAAGPRGAVRLTDPVAGTVAWSGPAGLDAALIELAQPTADTGRAGAVPEGFLPGELIWGEPAGTQPVQVRVTGMPGFAAQATGEAFEVATARGGLDPETYTASDRYAVDLDAWPEHWRDWAGVSGSAVTATTGGYLVGVTAWSDKPFAGRRLVAVPVRALLADAGFRAVLGRYMDVPDVEPVELVPVLSRPRPAGSIGALLRADAGLTDFAGRESELAELAHWLDERAESGPDVRVLLVTGQGGEGKTRLALELLTRSKTSGWTGGMLLPSTGTGPPEAITHPGRPLLLVIDYAAARAGEIAALAQAVVRARPQVPVRLLLLARTEGQWWSDLALALADDLPGLDTDEPPARKALLHPLQPLLKAGSPETDPAAMFTTTATRLAPLLIRFTTRTAADLLRMAADLPVPPLSAAGSGHVLTVQMAALAALLDAAAPALPAPAALGPGAVVPSDTPERPEDALLRHERDYRNRLAAARGLTDLRLVRDRALVGAALFGARGASLPDAREAACGLVAAALPEVAAQSSRQREVAAWIADLYPPDPPEPDRETEYWGQVVPDRLGEFLAVRLLADEATAAGEDDLLTSVAARSDDTGIARALLTLSRATEHDPRAATWIADLVGRLPGAAAPVALVVATYAERPAAVRDALINLGTRDPAALLRAVVAVNDVLPQFSLSRIEYSLSVARELTLLFTDLAGRDRGTYLPGLAMALLNYAVRLADAGRPEEALPVSARAVDAYGDLTEGDRHAYLPSLAMALNNHAIRLADAGLHQQALLVSAQAVDVYSDLTAGDRDEHLSGLAMALLNHAVRLAEDGRSEQAFVFSARAVDARRELTARDHDANLPGLALSLSNHAVRLAEAGRHAEALVVSTEALDLLRELAHRDRDVYLPNLAISLTNQARWLANAARYAEALDISGQALHAYAEMTMHSRDAYLPSVATSLSNAAIWLREVGRYEEALDASAQALDARRELIARNRAAHLADLVRSLGVHGTMLVFLGRIEEALGVWLEAFGYLGELPERTGTRLRSPLRVQLRSIYEVAPQRVETEHRRITGESFPEDLK
jgi:tetratricopeptide (TPR) repeat protein